MANKTLLFIPTYNCELQICRVLRSLQGSEIAKYFSEVLILDNGSKDKTIETARKSAETLDHLKVTIAINDENYNLGGSHKVAFQWARENGFDTLAVLHGDDQASISDILPLLKKGLMADVDCYLGARFKSDSRLTGYSKFRSYGNRLFNFLFSLALSEKIYDLGSGLNLYKVSEFDESMIIRFPDDLTFNYCMLIASCFYEKKIKFFGISWREYDQISNVRMVSQAKKLFKFLVSYIREPSEFVVGEHRDRIFEKYKTTVIYSKAYKI